MRATHDHSIIAAALAKALRWTMAPAARTRVHGGCINECYRWESDGGPVFVKLATADRLAMFEAEAAALEELSAARAVRVPRVLTVGAVEGSAFLALEWIDSTGSGVATEARLGDQLAKQHRVTSTHFGWHRDNAIGSTPQLNSLCTDWVDFFRERRLRYQFDLASENGFGGKLQAQGVELLERLGAFFSTYHPQPSLLHGDLWGGNWAADTGGAPVIFDPATYFGDRETDIAMTRLFGGFGDSFYRAYEAAWPMDPSARARTSLYNLYHVLNHLNLFGDGYLRQAESMVNSLLAELKP